MHDMYYEIGQQLSVCARFLISHDLVGSSLIGRLII